MTSSTHTLRLVALAVLASLMALPAAAQQDSYSYGGIGVGQSRAKVDEQRSAAALLGTGITTDILSRDRRDTAYKVFGGYQFNRAFALEAGYFDLGDFGFAGVTSNEDRLNGRVRARGMNLDLVGTLPLSDNWSALGRVGAAYTRVRESFDGSATTDLANTAFRGSNTDLKLGVGLQYAFNSSMLARVEAERYRVAGPVSGRTNVDVVSLSLVFPFGRSERAAPRAAMPMMMPMAAAPAPAPAPVAAPAPSPMPPPVVIVQAAPEPVAVVVPERRRVSFEAESLFGFDNSSVRDTGRVALDDFARQLDGTRFETITVEGHTDRLGSTAYNQKLSQERADAVKAYLVSAGRVDPAKISAVGKSESMPVTKPEDCKGNAPTAQLISCLQPDRRVEIEVAGTR
jgi:OOP family OmpA-OmpF porin